MTKRQELYNNSVHKSVGEIGQFAFGIDDVDFHVGDIVAFDTQMESDGEGDSYHYAGVITTLENKLGYGICNGYTDSVFNVNIKKVVPYDLLTRELLDFHKNNHIIIRDVPVKEMTVNEIEAELGYKIKVVGE